MTIVAWLVARVGFDGILPQALIDRFVALVCFAGALSLFVGTLVRPAERRWMVVSGVVDSLAALTFLWLERPDRLWVLPGVAAVSLWVLSLRAAIRRMSTDARTHDGE